LSHPLFQLAKIPIRDWNYLEHHLTKKLEQETFS